MRRPRGEGQMWLVDKVCVQGCAPATSPYLPDQEALLHVGRLQGLKQLHGLVQTLALLQLLLGAQHALEQDQAHAEDDLHP